MQKVFCDMKESTSESIKVSIIIPVYNVEKYIKECLNSVIAQDYPHIECLLVNDCSPDSSMNIVGQIIDYYEGPIEFKIINKKNNGGASSCRNVGIIESTGDYLFFIDSDDYLIDTNVISSFVAASRKYPKAEIITGRYLGYLEDKNYRKCEDLIVESNSDYQQSFLLLNFIGTPWNRLINKEFIINNNLFYDEGYIYEDHMWIVRSLPYVTQHIVLPSPTYYYSMNANGVMSSSNSIKCFKSRLKLLSIMKDQYSKCDFAYSFYFAFQLLALSGMLALSRDIERQYVLEYKDLRVFYNRNIVQSSLIFRVLSFILYSPFNKLFIFKKIRDSFFNFLLKLRASHL